MAGCFQAMVHDLRELLRLASGRMPQPTAAVLDVLCAPSRQGEQERVQVAELAARVQEATEQSVTLAYVDQVYTGDAPAKAAKSHGMELAVVKLSEAKKGFVLLPRRWVVERSFAWATRFRGLAKGYERLPETLAGLHYVVFAILMLVKAATLLKVPNTLQGRFPI